MKKGWKPPPPWARCDIRLPDASGEYLAGWWNCDEWRIEICTFDADPEVYHQWTGPDGHAWNQPNVWAPAPTLPDPRTKKQIERAARREQRIAAAEKSLRKARGW